MSDEMKVKATFEVALDRAVRDLNDFVTSISQIDPATREQEKSIDRLQKVAVNAAKAIQQTSASNTNMAQSSRAAAQAVNTQTSAITKLVTQNNALKRVSSDKGTYALPEMQSRISLMQQQTSETQKAAAAQLKFNQYLKASNARQAAVEEKALVETRAAVAKETEKANRVMLENAHQENRVFNQQQKQREQSSAAQIDYARQAQRSGVAYGQEVNDQLITQRYALYDVARTWGMVSAAATGASAAVLGFSIQHEAAFAQVIRTTGVAGQQSENLRRSIADLGASIPSSFSELSEIASLGGQLGIAAEGIEEFTRITAQLEATSDLTSQTAGTMIGRFQALLGVVPDQFENLASSVSLVGVNSVATESQIANTATQISAMGNFAGFTADQVVGLAGALSSVGVQPELARGTVTRTFTNMSVAVAEGGSKLAEFARLSGMSAREFQESWGTENFANTFQRFLRGLGEEGDQAVASLRELGITSVRDVPALMRLADAGDVVTRAFADAAQGWEENTELGRQFGAISETVAAKLQRLGNVIQTAMSESGSGPADALGILLDVVLKVADAFVTISRNPVGKVFLGLATAVTGLVGLFTGLLSVQALALASLFAMRTAAGALSKQGIQTTGIFRQYLQVVKELTGWTGVAAARQDAYNAALTRGAGAARANVAGLRAAAAASGVFGAALKSALVSTGILAAFVAIGSAIDYFSRQAEKAKVDFGGFSEALQADTAIYKETGESIRTLSTSTEESTEQLSPWAQKIEEGIGANVELTGAVSETTSSIEAQTVAIGENARAWLANKVANNEAFQEFYRNNQQLLDQQGIELPALLESMLGGREELDSYLLPFIETTEEAQRALQQAAGGANEWTAETFALNNEIIETQGTLYELHSLLGGITNDVDENAQQAQITAAVYGSLNLEWDETGDQAEELSNSIRDLTNEHMGAINAAIAHEESLINLGNSLYENGTAFDVYSAEGRANLGALDGVINAMVKSAGDDSAALAAMLAGLMDQLAAYGVNAVNELAFVTDMINSLTGGMGAIGMRGVEDAANNAGRALAIGFGGGADKASRAIRNTGRNTRDAAKEVRTLTDYVKDLERVFKAAFEIRFGLDNAIDGVADSWLGMAEYAAKAAEEVTNAAAAVKKADSDIKGLTAAKGTLEYQLTVAQEYGDTLRANEILAELAKNEVDLDKAQSDRAKSQSDLRKAQEATSKSLDGGTKASREQRAMVQDLIQAYAEQIAQMANSGMSQTQLARRTEQLKRQFVDQMVQMGYSRKEANEYARAFDDLAYSIRNVPRNITVSANTDPGRRAVQEFLASVKKSSASVNVGVGGLPTGATTRGLGESAGRAYAKGWVEQAKKYRRMLIQKDRSIPGGKRYSVDGGQTWFLQKGGPVPEYHATGGVHGMHPGSPRGSDTTPAWLTPGEFVQNRTAVDYYGLPFMNALNNMQIPKYLSVGGPATGSRSSSGGGPTLVELLPTQIRQIIDGLAVRIDIDGNEIASTVNRHNVRTTQRGTN